MNRNHLHQFAWVTSFSIVLSGCATSSIPVSSSEKLFYGGPILTMSGDTPEYAEALLVKDGTIRFVGSKQ